MYEGSTEEDLPWQMEWKYFKSLSSLLLGFSKDAGGGEKEKIAIVTDPLCLGIFSLLRKEGKHQCVRTR